MLAKEIKFIERFKAPRPRTPPSANPGEEAGEDRRWCRPKPPTVASSSCRRRVPAERGEPQNVHKAYGNRIYEGLDFLVRRRALVCHGHQRRGQVHAAEADRLHAAGFRRHGGPVAA
jgi:hypothetical protein